MRQPDNLRFAYSDPTKKKKNVLKIERLLCKEYGNPPKREQADPLDVLVQTILSQNTNDRNSGRAFDSLRVRFDGWNAARVAPVRQIEEAIRVGGLAKVKSKRIKRILSQVHKLHGWLSLRSLCTMESEDAYAALGKFQGVGPKTINCVLLFGCGMDVFPVDTHILRVSKRLGLIPENTGLVRAHKLWAEFLPPKLAYSLHLNLIEHGRQTCLARRPQCHRCCLKRLCKYYYALSSRQEDSSCKPVCH